MALNKEESILIPSKTAVTVDMLYGHHLEGGRHLGFPKHAVYFKLHYFKLIPLQANLLSSFISTYFAVNHTNFASKLSFRLRKHKI